MCLVVLSRVSLGSIAPFEVNPNWTATTLPERMKNPANGWGTGLFVDAALYWHQSTPGLYFLSHRSGLPQTRTACFLVMPTATPPIDVPVTIVLGLNVGTRAAAPPAITSGTTAASSNGRNRI